MKQQTEAIQTPNKRKAVITCVIAFVIVLAIGAAFYFIAGDELHKSHRTAETVSSKAALEEFTKGNVIEQTFYCPYDTLDQLTFLVGTMARQNLDIIYIYILDEAGNIILNDPNGPADDPLNQIRGTLHTIRMHDNEEFTVELNTPIENAAGRYFTLRLESVGGRPGSAVCFYYGNSVNTGKFTFATDITEETTLRLNGEKVLDADDQPCRLFLKVSGTDSHWIGANYWWVFAAFMLLFALLLLHAYTCYCKGSHKSLALNVFISLYNYSFLIKQLVARDFKAKYKRSVLGMFWSFLNPLLTMSIQYVVFSTIFKSAIPNFVVYLLSGIVCFNFFNEATGMCLSSIIGNATLINKVYMPKFIFPFSRSLSSSINLCFSLIPLLAMLLITRTPITTSVLLLPFALLMLFLLSYGIGLILATMMVFFRDTQFLWGIFSMLLSYLTPIFYPDSIIPESIMPIYRLNPLYHVVRIVRTILMDGVSPEPTAYLYCMILCLLPFLVGVIVFKKNENKFVLNI